MTPERLNKVKKVASQRQGNLTVMLENIYDEHNVGAVLRTCDAVGIKEIFLLITEPDLWAKHFPLGKRCTKGARRWLDVHYYKDPEACFEHIQSKYEQIFAANLDEHATGLYEFNLSGSVALLFGNERDGLSAHALTKANAQLIIPQMGMTESLNISVSCAVALYESLRQRMSLDQYHNNNTMSYEQLQQVTDQYITLAGNRDKRGNAVLIK